MLSNVLPALPCRARVWLSAVKCLPPTHPLTLNNQFSSSGSMNPKIWPCRPPPQTAHLSHLNELLLQRKKLSQSYLSRSYTDYWLFHSAKHLVNETQKVKNCIDKHEIFRTKETRNSVHQRENYNCNILLLIIIMLSKSKQKKIPKKHFCTTNI